MKSCDEITKCVLARRDEHDKKIKTRNRMIMRIGVPTVSLCLAVIVGIGFWNYENIPPNSAEDAVVPGLDDTVDPGEAENAIGYVTDIFPDVPNENGGEKVECPPDKCPKDGEDEIWIEPQWAEKALYTKYPEFDFGGTAYYTAATWIEKVYLGEELGSSVANGYDIYTDTSYEMDVTVYEIKGISTAAALAVSYNGFEGQYAVYTDNWYYPETLGEFIEDLNLRENLTFGTIYHTFFEYESYMMVEYEISDPSFIWNMLLSDGSLVNVAESVTDEEMSYYKESMSVSVSVELLGIKNVSLSVTENGYLDTNILGIRKLFYIGEEKAQEFFDYVEKNFEPVREEIPSTTTAVTVPADDIGGEPGCVEPGYPGDVVVQTETARYPEDTVNE